MFPFRERQPDTDLVMSLMRFAAGSVFLWFGLDKWLHPELWTHLVPEWWWLSEILSAQTLVLAAGVLEFALGAGLLDGRYGRMLPSLASLWILVASLGWYGVGPSLVRDASLLGICLTLLVNADRQAGKPWPPVLIKNLGYAYFTYLLAIGVVFLRASGQG
jgi:hypothetical protein